MRFMDKQLLMHLDPLPSDRVENSVLYSVTYFFLYNLLADKKWLASFENNGTLYDYPDNQTHSTSHDNMTAIITMMVRVGMPVNHLKIFHNYYHPRDFIYMGYLQRKWWAYPLLPLLFIVFLHMALTKYKVRNGRKIFKTDTEILYWIRLQLPKRFWFIHFTGRVIVPLLKLKFGDEWVKTMMDTYYQHPEHPNRLAHSMQHS